MSIYVQPVPGSSETAPHPLQFAPGAVLTGSVSSLDDPGDADAGYSIALCARHNRFGGRLRLYSRRDTGRPNQTFIPVANKAAELLAERIDGVPQSNICEALANIPTRAHIVGGATTAANHSHGVSDRHRRVLGYENLLACDGAAIFAGVHPSLPITGLGEHPISHVPAAADSRTRRLPETIIETAQPHHQRPRARIVAADRHAAARRR
jgi:hypothetical protein